MRATSPWPRLDKPRRHGLSAAFGYAWAGLTAAWQTQRNVRIQLVLAAIVVVAGLVFHLAALGWAAIALATAFVLAAELLNTALEAVVDLASPEYHPLAKRAKDVAAAAVLVASVGAVAAGVLVVASTWR